MPENQTLTPKTRRSRSTGFPTISLDEALILLDTAKAAGLDMSNDVFAGEIGMSPRGSAFLAKIAALRDYKLIEKTASRVIFTNLAKDILFDTSGKDEIKKSKLQEAFKNCKIFDDIFSRLSQGGGESKGGTVGNIAVRDFGVSPQWQNRFIKSFVDSAQVAGLLNKGEDNSLHLISKKEGEIHKDTQDSTFKEPSSPSLSPAPSLSKSDEGYVKNIEERGENWTLHIRIVSSYPLPKIIRTNINNIVDTLEENNQTKVEN